jgi:EmrB/QacA subfamily drug resistance transporter
MNSSPTSTAADRVPIETKLIVAGLMLSIFLVALDGTIVSTAMPSIVGNLGGFNLYAWVPSVYLLASAVSTPIYGKLADLYGRRRILFFGIGLFLIGSVASGASQSMGMLIVFRAIQGLGAGAVLPVSITVVGDLFTLEQRARFQGIFSSVWGISAVVGPLLGGLMVDRIGWRWIFYINLPVALPAIGLLWWFFKERYTAREHRLDFAGATFLSIGLTAVLLLLLEGGQAWNWLSWQTAVLALGTALSLGLFVRTEQRASEPVVPLSLFRNRIIAVSGLGALFAGVVLISVSFEVPLFVQGVLGQDALHAGIAVAPMTIGWPVAAAVSGGLAIRFGYRVTATVGLLFQIVGATLLLLLTTHSSYLTAAGFSFLIGAGLGLSSTPMVVAVQSVVARAQRGVATATNMFVRSFGSVVGLAVMGVIVNHSTGSYGGSAATTRSLDVHARGALPPAVLHRIQDALFIGLHNAYVAALIAAAIGLVVALGLPGGSARDHELQEDPMEQDGDLVARQAG